jgi:hypothetical protein
MIKKYKNLFIDIKNANLMPRIYTTLAEALEDIEFDKVSRLWGKFSLGYIPPSIENDEAIGHIMGAIWNMWGMPSNPEWAREKPEKFPHFEEKRKFLHAILELVKNADAHCPQMFKDKLFWTEAYFSKKGILVGTIQEEGFFTPEQIELLRQGKPVESTRGDSSNFGFRHYILPDSDGLLILEKEKAIYASRILDQPLATKNTQEQ